MCPFQRKYLSFSLLLMKKYTVLLIYAIKIENSRVMYVRGMAVKIIEILKLIRRSAFRC